MVDIMVCSHCGCCAIACSIVNNETQEYYALCFVCRELIELSDDFD